MIAGSGCRAGPPTCGPTTFPDVATAGNAIIRAGCGIEGEVVVGPDNPDLFADFYD